MSKQRNYKKIKKKNFKDKNIMKTLLLTYIKKYAESMLREFCIKKYWKCYKNAINM